ncbi:hypothetical protein [Streptomyces sp. Wh19]|uniref:hypothetical protein n=1 Tax=Streptomyces sp. Wh19 TaxID=3076629 RepID=UPI0029584883|nr:hypothetical protein [Streptomyces sp. Wh19]
MTEYADSFVEHAIDKILRVPSRYRRFNQCTDQAAALHRIDEPLLERLLDLGLPHRQAGRERRFDALDLENIAMSLRLPCPRRIALQWWSRTLNNTAEDENNRLPYELRIGAPCPVPHSGACDFALHHLVEAAAGSVAPQTVSPGSYTLHISRPRCHIRFGTFLDFLVCKAKALEFHLIPDELEHDMGFVAETGLADCKLGNRYLAREAASEGLNTRLVAGLLLSRPVAAWHWWMKVQFGDAWYAADPFLLQTLATWKVADTTIWPPDRSPEELFWELGDHYVYLVTHNGVGAPWHAGVRSVG